MTHKFPYRWTFADAVFTKDKGKVFSCFACGGGSTMGYKLAGFDVIGDNEIDPRMNKIYVANHHPKLNYLCDIRELVTQAEEHNLPDEMYELDILDASFPCTSFSTAGLRDKGWGKEKQFREGGKSQVLDTLCFDSIQLADALRPKIVLFENVKGIIQGKAMVYTENIIKELDNIGYVCQYWLLNGNTMGLPQSRERVFFIAVRKDFASQRNLLDASGKIQIDMAFTEDKINYEEIADDEIQEGIMVPGSRMREYWDNRQKGDLSCADVCERLYGKRSCFSNKFAYKEYPLPTITANCGLVCFHKPGYLSDTELRLATSFPMDYDFMDNKVGYIVGMSVPPIMMAQVASRIYEYLLT